MSPKGFMSDRFSQDSDGVYRLDGYGPDDERELKQMLMDRLPFYCKEEVPLNDYDRGHFPIADVVCGSVSFEVKHTIDSNTFQKALGQSSCHTYFGYKPVIVSVEREGQCKSHNKVDILRDNDVGYVLWDTTEEEFYIEVSNTPILHCLIG